MSLKIFRSNLLLCALLLAVFLFLKDSVPLLSFVIIIAYFYTRTDGTSALILCALCGLLLIPLHDTKKPEVTQARIIAVHQSYAIAQSGFCKFMLYTETPAPFDALIELNGEFSPITSQKSFFGFDFAEYMNNQGVYYRYEGEGFTIVKDTPSPRRMLQKKADECEDPLVRAFVYKAVFNIMDDSLISGSFLQKGGFSFAGIMLVMEHILSYFLNKKHTSRIMLAVNCMLIGFYGFHILLVSALLRRLLRIKVKAHNERSALWIILMILIFRKQIMSAAFLFPLCFTLFQGKENDTKLLRYTLLCAMQSILNQKISPFDILFYPYLVHLYGIFWLYGIFIIFAPWLAWNDLILVLNRLSLFTDRFCIYGSVLGFGLPFFLIWIFSFYHHRHFAKIAFVSLFVFLLTGMFHPFSEVSFINVGQGDCILIKGPFLSDNVLIDTGKPQQYENVCAALHARGIHHIHTFFVTHMDSDHCGNMESIMEDFRVDRKITEHEGTSISRYLVFHDLNSLKNEDKNESSLVLAFQLNGLDFLFCGDADQKCEEEIVHHYGNIRCDVLKLSHHGSKTGSCDLFLDTVKPELGIISSGAYSIYHHPSPETLQRLLKRHIPYLDTKDHGDISIFMIGPLRLLISSDGCFELL